MCGIFGVTVKDGVDHNPLMFRRLLDDLFILSESRGKEAAGIALLDGNSISVFKQPHSASRMIRDPHYAKLFEPLQRGNSGRSLAAIGHSRLVTNGSQEEHDNNQPVITSGAVGIHNGIVVNIDALWAKYPQLDRKYEVDTEVIFALIRHFYKETGSVITATRRVFAEIEGMTSIALFFEDIDSLLLATNNGSLYRASGNGWQVFGSEEYILKELTRRGYVHNLLGATEVVHLSPSECLLIDLSTGERTPFRLDEGELPASQPKLLPSNRPIADVTPRAKHHTRVTTTATVIPIPSELQDHYKAQAESITYLKRCTRCILPETMPFIQFDSAGVCNFCRNYKKIQTLGPDALEEAVAPYRRNDGRPDCLATFSGGRDSSFGLHYVKTVLKLNPVAYSYDWGMITDLARRNQSRLCGKLGVEHILVSADITKKRANIRKNVLAWLKQPDLGTVPLFMAGDKQYFYYANKLREQLGVKIVIFCENLLETTSFKSGFCGIPPKWNDEHTYTMSLANKAKLASYYGREYITNPAYLNSSLLDTVGAYISYYFIPHNYLNLFGYLRWEEKTVVEPLLQEYDWEIANDTNSTWRIGDGTASFYNYIYLMMAGFTENDTFRSNQIREGMMTREQALATIADENQPRWESIQWYCNTIGIDFLTTVKTINAAKRLY